MMRPSLEPQMHGSALLTGEQIWLERMTALAKETGLSMDNAELARKFYQKELAS